MIQAGVFTPRRKEVMFRYWGLFLSDNSKLFGDKFFAICMFFYHNFVKYFAGKPKLLCGRSPCAF